MQPSLSEITSKNTKQEIFDAYEQLLEEVKKHPFVPSTKKEELERTGEKQVVDTAARYTLENILKNATELKIHMSQALDTLVNKLTEEAKKFSEIEQAIAIEKRQLNELHNIQIAADTLQLLITDIEKRKQDFASGMESTKNAWDQEKLEHERDQKESLERMKKEREREEEEYEYALKQKRRKDEDTYELALQEKKRKWENEVLVKQEELTRREHEVVQKEAEFLKLETEVEQFSERLDSATTKASLEARRIAEKEATTREQLFQKEVEGERALLKSQILNLQQIVEKQNEQSSLIKHELEAANKKSQELATKVIEGASGMSTLHTLKDMGVGVKEKGENK